VQEILKSVLQNVQQQQQQKLRQVPIQNRI